MSGPNTHRGLLQVQSDNGKAPDTAFAEHSLSSEDHEALERGDRNPSLVSIPDSSQSAIQRLKTAGFLARPPLTPLSREVLGSLSDEEVDLLVSLKERLEAAQGGTLSLLMGDMLSEGPWSISQRLRGKLELVMPLMYAPNQALLNHRKLPQLYPEWALTFYFEARVFLPLMEAAMARARSLAANDPVAAGTARYLEQHIEEERHGVAGYGEAHLPDLEMLGVDPGGARRRPLPLPIAALAGFHYDWIVHRHPVALLGFLEVVEGYPPSLRGVESLIARSGLPRTGFRFLLEHADLDLEHRDELHAVLDGLPVTPEQEAVLGLSALRTVDLVSRVLWEALDSPNNHGDGARERAI